MDKPVKYPKITYAVLFILLAMRMGIDMTYFTYDLFSGSDTRISSAVEWFALTVMGHWIFPTFVVCSPILITLAILLNQENMQAMNMDKPFVILFIYAGLIIAGSFFLPMGWLSGIAVSGLFLSLLSRRLVFASTKHRNLILLVVLIVFGFLIFIFAFSRTLAVENIQQAARELYTWHFSTYVYEEIIYRGLLWMFLKGKNWKDSTIVLFQAFLFWISHIMSATSDPIFFFAVVPIAGMLLGYMVWRTKSLTTSTVVHVLLNVLIEFLS